MKLSEYNVFVPTKGKRDYILYNTYVKSILAVDEELKNALLNERFDDIPKDVFKILSDEGIIIKDDLDEKKVLRTIFEKTKWWNPGKVQFIVITTYDCNLRCPYCYVSAGRLHTKPMDLNAMRLALKFMKKRFKECRAEELSLGLYGGEPFLNEAIALKLAEETKKVCDKRKSKFFLECYNKRNPDY